MIDNGCKRLIVFCVAGLMAFGGCLFSPEKDKDPVIDGGGNEEYENPTSPGKVLANLQTSYRYKNIDRYEDCMAENFTFWPSEADTGIDYEYLTRDQDRLSTLNMFDQVENIQIRLDVVNPFPSPYSEYPAEEGHEVIEVPFVRIEVLTREGDEGDPLIYLVNDDQARFIFKPDSTQNPVTWKIVYQKDLSTGREAGPPLAAAR